MAAAPNKYRFLLIQAFQLPADSRFRHGVRSGTKEQQLMNYESVKHLLEDVDWDHHPGALTTYGDWAVENQEEFVHSAAARQPAARSPWNTNGPRAASGR